MIRRMYGKHVKRIYNKISGVRRGEKRRGERGDLIFLRLYAEDSMKALPFSIFFFNLVKHRGNNSLDS